MKYLLLFILAASAAFAEPIAGDSGSFTVGRTVLLSVTNAGTGPFTYHWTQNGWPSESGNSWAIGASAETSICTLDTTIVHGTYEYRCTITNSEGSTVSNIVYIAIVPVPVLTIQEKEQLIATAANVSYDAASRRFGAPSGLLMTEIQAVLDSKALLGY